MPIDKTETLKAHPKVPADLQPGRVFVTLDEEIENFEREAKRFRADPEALEGEFTPFRLRMGTYGQRQTDQQMMLQTALQQTLEHGQIGPEEVGVPDPQREGADQPMQRPTIVAKSRTGTRSASNDCNTL